MIFHAAAEYYLLAMCSVKSATSLKVKGVVTQAGMEKTLEVFCTCATMDFVFRRFSDMFGGSESCAGASQAPALFVPVCSDEKKQRSLIRADFGQTFKAPTCFAVSINHNHCVRGSVQFGKRERQMFSLLFFFFF